MKFGTVGTYYTLSALTTSISFTVATYTTFLQQQGLTKFEANLVNASFFLTMFLLEVPTGVYADIFGRKRSFILSCFLFGIGMLVYSVQSTFWGFVAAEMICAFAATFATGAFQAWFVDQMHHEGERGSLSLYFAKNSQICSVVGPTFALLGAFAGSYDIRFPWVIGGMGFVLAAMLGSLLMHEDYFKPRACTLLRALAGIRKTLRISMLHTQKNVAVRVVLILMVIQLIAIQAPNMQWQLVYRDLAGGQFGLGFVWFAMSLALGFGSRLSLRLKVLAGSEVSALRFAQCATGITLFLSGVCLTAVPASSLFWFIIHEVPRGAFGPVRDGYLNAAIPQNVRATVLSFTELSSRLGAGIGLLLSGFVVDRFDVGPTWQVSGLLLVLVTLFAMRKR